jgi:hypothetical protein
VLPYTALSKKQFLVDTVTAESRNMKEHFDKLLNTEDPKELIKTGNKEISEVEVEVITIENVEKAI